MSQLQKRTLYDIDLIDCIKGIVQLDTFAINQSSNQANISIYLKTIAKTITL